MTKTISGTFVRFSAITGLDAHNDGNADNLRIFLTYRLTKTHLRKYRALVDPSEPDTVRLRLNGPGDSAPQCIVVKNGDCYIPASLEQLALLNDFCTTPGFKAQVPLEVETLQYHIWPTILHHVWSCIWTAPRRNKVVKDNKRLIQHFLAALEKR